MKTYQLTVTLYDFNELPTEDAKEKVRNWYQETNADAMQDVFIDSCMDTIKNEYGLKNGLNVAYSLNYCQGDGLCIHGTIHANDIDDKFFENVITKGLTKRQREIIYNELQQINFDRIDRMYSHANTVTIDLISNSYNEKHFNAFNKATENVENWYKNICKKLENEGYEFFYNVSDEDINEFAIDNNIMFEENGTPNYHLQK